MLPEIGAYTVTVTNSSPYSTSYALSATSIRNGPCTTLSAADLSPAAPPRPTEQPAERVANCFEIPGAADDVIRFGQELKYVLVFDSVGAEVCQGWSSTLCTLTGSGPYRLFTVGRDAWDRPDFRFGVARMSNPDGCLSLAIAPFGDPHGAIASGPLAGGATDCRSITVAAGRYSVREGGHNQAGWQVYTRAGEPVGCGSDDCELPAGAYTLLVENSPEAEKDGTFNLAVTDLSSTEGCAPQINTRWDTPAPLRTQSAPIQLDCQPIDGKAGERLLTEIRGVDGAPGEGDSWIVDPTGAEACTEDSRHDGCVLQGDGPFRVLSTRDHPDPGSYVLDLGRLSDPVGCEPAVLSTFGTPGAAAASSRCRELTVTTATTYTIDSRTLADQSVGRGAYGIDGLERCADMRRCRLEPGKYTVIAPVGRRVALFTTTATAGCEVQPADTLAARNGNLASETQYDCLQLQAPAGARIALTEPVGSAVTDGYVVDSTGRDQCGWNSRTYEHVVICELTGTAPFRVVVHQRLDEPDGSQYHLTVTRLDQATGCPAFPQSDFAAPGGVTVALRPERFVACLAIPADGHAAKETLEHVRTGSIGSATTLAVTADSDQTCVGREGMAWFEFCDYETGKAVTIFVIGSADTASHRISRRDMTSTARGCTAVTATAVGGISGSGTVPDASVIRCFKITGATSDRFSINARDAKGSIVASVFAPNGDYVCKTYSETRCLATGSTGYQVMVFNDPGTGTAGAFTLEAYRIGGAAGPAPDCTKLDSAYGFGPLTGELTNSKRTVCVAFPMKQDKKLVGQARNQVPNSLLPIFTPYGTDSNDNCTSYAGEDGRFDCEGSRTDFWMQSILLSLPESGETSLKYLLKAECETPLCGGATFGVTGAAPTSAAAGVPVAVSLNGKSLHLKDVVRFKAAGKPDVVGVVKSVSADRTAASVTVDLAGAAVGPRSLVVESFAGGSATLANAFTVTPPALVNTKAPTVVAPVRVGDVVKVNVGAWSPAASSYTYQWRDNGAAIRGAGAATYTPAAGMVGRSLSVTVTAVRSGYASKAVTTAGVVVGVGAAPKASKGPVVTGAYKVGKTVSASTGTWAPACTSVKFQWYLAGKAISGGTKASLALTAAMGKKAVHVGVTCARAGHASGVASTRPVTVAV
ncbi:hypothetical protein [Kribbella sandramycini]|uniref:Ig-like domain-containing protein n=2 Tax=Kribbella sandramycini TaxID=60450 RepID=A0A841SPV8_9ACTN|nr:hypothetical protein [Kribbella sandramycini]MBB6571032.1 hypothetical protein [Kribbella sandramycini]